MNNLIKTHWWVPVALVLNVIYAIFSCLSNQDDEHWKRWMLCTYLTGALFPIWLYVARTTKQMAFDALLFDLIILVGFIFGNLYMGVFKELSGINKVGAALVVIGLMLLKWSR